MTTKRAKQKKKYFTIEEANAALPLVKAIVQDIADLARELREHHERIQRSGGDRSTLGQAYQEEVEHLKAELERGQEKMQEYESELRNLGVELKDYYIGLIDFPCRMNGKDAYLCWRLDETTVNHWHELDAGFAGRKKL